MSEKEIDGEKIDYGISGDNGSYSNYKRIRLYRTKKEALDALHEKDYVRIFIINTSQIQKDGFTFIEDTQGVWYIEHIPNKYFKD